jgi:type II secretory pathway component PulM
MSILYSRTLWGVLGGIALVLLIFHWGDAYGPNAQRYAAVRADLEAKNAVLTRQLQEDAETVSAERADAQANLSEFQKAAATFKNKCPLDQTQVDALNKLIGG